MEYPFKDLLPLDEVLEREGYYKDWTHLDPKVFYSLTQISEYIKTKGFGVDVRLLIAQLAEHFSLKTTQINETEQFFKDIMQELAKDKDFYSLPEIAGARGGFGTLGERLSDTAAQLTETERGLRGAENILNGKADKDFVDAQLELKSDKTDVDAKFGELGSVATFKGSDTKANIQTLTDMQVGDEWYSTDTSESLRYNGVGWVPVGGAISLGNGSVTNPKIAHGAVNYHKIADGSIYGAKLPRGFAYRRYVIEGTLNSVLDTGNYRVSPNTTDNPCSNLAIMSVIAERNDGYTKQVILDTVDASQHYFRALRVTDGVATVLYDWKNFHSVNDESVDTASLIDGAVTVDKTDFIEYGEAIPPSNGVYESISLKDYEDTAYNGYMVQENGQIVSSEATAYMTTTDFVPLIGGLTYKAIFRSVLFYDANDNMIVGSFVNNVGSIDLEFTVPLTATKARFSVRLDRPDNINNIQIKRMTATDDDRPLKFTKEVIGLGGGGGEAYDQSLNTTDSVKFVSVETDLLEVTGAIRTGTLANPPSGLLSGDMWADTTDSATHPIVRVKL